MTLWVPSRSAASFPKRLTVLLSRSVKRDPASVGNNLSPARARRRTCSRKDRTGQNSCGASISGFPVGEIPSEKNEDDTTMVTNEETARSWKLRLNDAVNSVCWLTREEGRVDTRRNDTSEPEPWKRRGESIRAMTTERYFRETP